VSDLVAATALRRADATRAVSSFTARLVEEARGVPPTASFLAYSDLSAFANPPVTPVPEAPRIVFVGSLEPYKNIDRLAAAWRRLAPAIPSSHLTIVGSGSQQRVVAALLADLPAQVTHFKRLEPTGVAGAIDEARALVLPSFPEGLGRVVLEAFARGRGVVATDGGGIPDMVTDGQDGLLVAPHDTEALTEALRRVLEDRELAVRLGGAARQAYQGWHQTPEQFAEAYRGLVELVLGGAR
jgi:glycosyltransferase involved in cell wall biosynthesis